MTSAPSLGARPLRIAYITKEPLPSTDAATVQIVQTASALARAGAELFGSRYPAAVLPFQIYSLILLDRIVDHGSTLRAAGDTRALWRASALALGANLGFGIPLTLGFGMLGTACGTVAAYFLSWAYTLKRIARATDSKFVQVVPWGLYASVLGIALVAALLAAWAGTLGPQSPLLQLGMRWALFAALFVAGIRLLGVPQRLPEVPADHAGFASRAVA
jgi:O-antigen/teichoic acid export membrane protein